VRPEWPCRRPGLLCRELRDLETTSLAIKAAETGHLVFALHTNSAARRSTGSSTCFQGNAVPVRTMLSESLEGVCAQSLIRPRTASRGSRRSDSDRHPALRNLIGGQDGRRS